MALDHPLDTDDGAVPAAVRRFCRHRVMELTGLVVFVACIAMGVALATWSPSDPSLNRAFDSAPGNFLGIPGAVSSDHLFQVFGLGVIPLAIIPLAWGARLLAHRGIVHPVKSFFAFIACVFSTSAFLALFPSPAAWPLSIGLGGQAGEVLKTAVLAVLTVGLKGVFATFIALVAFGGIAGLTALAAAGIAQRDTALLSRVFGDRLNAISAFTWSVFHYLRMRRRARLASRPRTAPAVATGGSRFSGLFSSAPKLGADGRVEPSLTRKRGGEPPWLRLPAADEEPEEEAAQEESEDETVEEEADEEAGDTDAPAPVRIGKSAKPLKQTNNKRGKRVASFELPPLNLLAEPKKSNRGSDLSDEQLEENARMLEGVLDDFGVKGQIIKVRPGPVVTLYELEPAPGIKSSRVISLADDIARSMSAISARVAVVSGRNAIGIELPNSKRETVYLRELLGSEAFENTTQNLALALGKNIGGEPVFADLARMPHLLIAGTTGSGKSVGINTMILSLLYRHGPDRCKLIMIDPKMLELSVYEGIPHLLAPVVTDPRKAVVALKWAVREMEDRYRKMSKVGVRNIEGFNARLAQAATKGQSISRTVQTGFDAETGQPVFEREEMDLSPMPFIVVIIDEMADLMLVAGKDIEGAVQRLAQMARAAGIHVVMATQRPSVDVITGTIKANFPTRVSFQVTSKIDSRTILGEQGAEQLLGQGDMLYMAGGGRISRLHGPFVSDGEVEKIVNHLKAQGAPEYLEAVTEEPDEEAGGEAGSYGAPAGGSGDELYDQAVAVVLRDKKVSTSYVQRRLQVGYNKAASLIERMEKEGLISSPNATGKREILVPGDSARD
ncbi:hypothetical protein BH10PSE7_BH10PSE7_33650 [soil metagenome]